MDTFKINNKLELSDGQPLTEGNAIFILIVL